MTEQETEQTQVDESTEEKESSITSLDDALKVIDSLRKENAAKRVKAKDVEDKAKRWEEYVESQKTELEKLTESKAALEKELQDIKGSALRDRIASEEGVPKDLMEFLVGTDENTLRTQAKKLAAGAQKDDGQRQDFFAGQRGTPVQPTEEEGLNGWFGKFYRDFEESRSTRQYDL